MLFSLGLYCSFQSLLTRPSSFASTAKRNFRKRHRHDKEKTEGGSSGTESNCEDESATTSFISFKRGDSSDQAKKKAEASLIHKVQAAAARSQHMEVDTANKSLERSVSTVTGDSSSSFSSKQDNKSDKSDSADDEAGRSTSADEAGRSSSPSDSLISNNPRVISDDGREPQMVQPIPERAGPAVDRAARWAALLERRPSSDDSDAMSAWLLEVLSVSETTRSKTPPQSSTESSENDETMPSPSSPCKKRHHSLMTCSDRSGSSSREDAGSFAEWKDRKRHKGLPKMGYKQHSRTN